jgi:aspartate racemase
MKTIGLIGGMSWESSIEYYRIINETIRDELGGLHSAKSIMVSVDFAEIETLQHAGDWPALTRRMIEAARQVQAGGGDFVVICTNTMHKMADDVAAAITIPILHIADATAARIKAQNINTIGLLGTRFTMEEDFYKGRLIRNHGLKVLVPDDAGRADVHRIIYDELVAGKIRAESKARYLQIMQALVARGAQGIILGCTEIGLLVNQEDCQLPVFDTTRIHAQEAVKQALER